MDVLSIEKSLMVDRSLQELVVVELAILVEVEFSHQLFHAVSIVVVVVMVKKFHHAVIAIPLAHFLYRYLPISIPIEPYE